MVGNITHVHCKGKTKGYITAMYKKAERIHVHINISKGLLYESGE